MTDNGNQTDLAPRQTSFERLPDSEGYLGRRVERDGSWTMYHVFTGAPARVDNRLTTGLTKAAATALMLERNADALARASRPTAPPENA